MSEHNLAPEGSGKQALFEESADLCEFSDGSSCGASSFDADEGTNNLTDDEEGHNLLLRTESLQWNSFNDILDTQHAQHNNEVTSLKNDLQEANAHAEARLADLARQYERKLNWTIAEYDAQFTELMQKYKAARRQLAAAQAQDQGVFQDMTDVRLMQKVLSLRQAIRSFALLLHPQHLPGDPRNHSLRWSAKETRHIPFPDHALARDGFPVTPVSMQAYTWKIMASKVFGKFVWAAGDAEGLHDVWVRLQGRTGGGPQALRKLQAWKATTASMMLGPAPSQTQFTTSQEDDRQIKEAIANICATAYPFRLFQHSDMGQNGWYRGHLYHIVEQAVKLDLEICKQGAVIDWAFGTTSRADLDNAGTDGVTTRQMVVTAPALTKLGMSNGDDLDKEPRVLLEQDEASPSELESRFLAIVRKRDGACVDQQALAAGRL
ncbi:hypothetical protein PG994_004312 [Apiospora phragmitis]|uniref:Uncharacterized protein n=1 Tax=Apiospora phragmitis TaxID=2905665 RepID=A0ABR1VU97_9PEZI